MMNVIEHTINWYKGEAFEALLCGLFGLFLILITIVFLQMGTTQGAQAMTIPLIVVGLIIGGSGAYNFYSNHQKVNQFQSDTPNSVA